jgi:two-component system cell cycle sensor histidine kinase/response regulator CckA
MSRPLRALIVEDSENDAQLIVHALKAGGFDVASQRVDTSDSMVTALSEGKWDIILSDQAMPHFSAPEALVLLREGGFTTPFIIISGVISAELAVSLMRSGAHDWVSKNDLSRLVPAVERELQEAEMRHKQIDTDEALRRSDEKFRTIVETTDELIWIVDSFGSLVYINPAVKDILGYAPEEFQGKEGSELMRLLHEDDLANMQKTLSDMFKSKARWNELILRFKSKSGDIRFIDINGTPLFDSEGEFSGFQGTGRDITERKKMEDRIIEEGDRAKSYFDFLAHDMANILSPIVAYADLLSSDKSLSENSRKRTLKIVGQGKRANVLIRNLRILQSIGTTKPEEIGSADLRSVLPTVVETIMRDQTDKRPVIIHDIPQNGQITVRGGEWIEDVFRIILDNAIRYSPEESPAIEIKVAPHDGEKGKASWGIEIIDSGPGMSDDLKRELIKFIDRSNRGFKGVASSLPFCASIVRLLGGELRIEDKVPGSPEKGTKVVIILPSGN